MLSRQISRSLIAIIGIGEIITFLLFLLGVQTSALFISFLFGHFFDTKGQENTALITILTTTLLFILLEKLEIRIWILEPFIISIIFSCLVWMLFYKIQNIMHSSTLESFYFIFNLKCFNPDHIFSQGIFVPNISSHLI